jgi:hypothetical protein
MTRLSAPAAQAPRIVPGSLVRVNPAAETRFAGRSGLLVALEGAAAVVRFSATRSYVFSLDDLLPVVSFARGAGAPWRAPSPTTSPAWAAQGPAPARGRGATSRPPTRPAPSPVAGSVARHGGRAGDGHHPSDERT